jgi:hypothetical protein
MAEKDEQTQFNGLQFLMLLLITVVAVGIGIHFKSAADPGTESKQFASQPPLTLDFYVSNPDISLKVQIYIYQMKDADKETVTAQAKIPRGETGSILMLSSLPQEGGQTPRLTPPPPSDVTNASADMNQKPYDSYYYTEVPLPNGQGTAANGFSDLVAYFKSSKTTENTNASSYGHLPSVDALGRDISYQTLNPYVLILGERNASGKLSHIVVGPYADYVPSYNANSGVFYPTNTSVAETLTGVAATLQKEQIDYISPSGNILGHNYVWQSVADLEPIFKVTNQDAIQEENNDAFLAGIAIGVAGGAAIAVIQAVPKRRRKPDPKSDRTPAHTVRPPAN